MQSSCEKQVLASSFAPVSKISVLTGQSFMKTGTGTSLAFLKIIEVLLKSDRKMENLHEDLRIFMTFTVSYVIRLWLTLRLPD